MFQRALGETQSRQNMKPFTLTAMRILSKLMIEIIISIHPNIHVIIIRIVLCKQL